VLYLIADGAAPARGQARRGARGAVRLASVVRSAPAPTDVVVNELTTVAAAYALAQFIEGPNVAGKSPGLRNAAAMVHNLVDVSTGEIGSVLANPPNGTETSTLRHFNTLANMLAACVNEQATCATLFDLATPPGGVAPHDTLQAAVNIAHYPWQNVTQLFDQSQILVLYAPALESAPTAWTLALRFVGDGMTMDGPGNVAIDAEGNLWVTNNYEFGADPVQPVCGGKLLLRFTPTGEYFPGSPYQGGGLNGAGWGITIDPNGNVWVGNFGFAGEGCTEEPPSDSVSKFSPDGIPLSPDAIPPSTGGFTAGDIDWPQGTVSDMRGNIWIANCGNGSVTQYPGGNPAAWRNFPSAATGLKKPFGIAIDHNGWAYVAGNGSDNVAVIRPDGSSPPWSPVSGGGLVKPLGIAADSRGNMWVANSTVIDIPCAAGHIPADAVGGSITLITHGGKATRFSGGGLTIPWGIAVDGNDNVWVANFARKRLSHFCGTDTSRCPPGFRTGDPISPDDTGYGFDGLTRNSLVAIDPSGNVWVANNWKTIAVQTNPGGYEMVVFIGLAAPVHAPQIGPPRQP
jgi:sugar lactone lactonase YvrE